MSEVIDTVIEDSMVLDIGNVDFFSLEDSNIAVTETVKKYAPEKKQVPVVEEIVEEDSTEESDPDADAEDIDFDNLSESEEVEEDTEESSEEVEEEEEEGDVEVTDEDGEEVDYESYEVTLPSGETVNLAEAVKGYQEAKKLEAAKAELATQKEAFEQGSKDIGRYLELAKLEAQRVIDDYKDFDWNDLAKSDPASYVDNREFLEKYQQRHQEILKAMQSIEDKRTSEAEAAVKEKARECVTVLERDVPGWGPDLYKTLMSYAVENGADPTEIQQCVDPVVFKLLHKSMQFDKGKAVVKAKIKNAVKSPSKVVRATAKEDKVVDQRKITMTKKIQSGQVDSRDVDAMFNMLED